MAGYIFNAYGAKTGLVKVYVIERPVDILVAGQTYK